VSTDKREERKRREKEEALKNYYDVQKRKLDIDDANAKMRAEDHMIMTADLTAMNEVKRAWFKKRHKEIIDRTN
jgi:hypothetical protein